MVNISDAKAPQGRVQFGGERGKLIEISRETGFLAGPSIEE
jgi:hypothetical protein